MAWLPCPYLGIDVELTDERVRHIRRRHNDVLTGPGNIIATTLAEPDRVRRRESKPDEAIFIREFDEFEADSFVAVVVREDDPPDDRRPARHWVVTAYRTEDEPAIGRIEWIR